MAWIPLLDISQLEDIRNNSFSRTQCIFKHSTRCSFSGIAQHRLNEEIENLSQLADFNFLDLLKHRDISNSIADKFSVQHESPQILIISKGECVFEESHLGINPTEILSQLNALAK